MQRNANESSSILLRSSSRFFAFARSVRACFFEESLLNDQAAYSATLLVHTVSMARRKPCSVFLHC